MSAKHINTNTNNTFETTKDGDKIIDWEIEYNPLMLVSAAGNTITDKISPASAEFSSI